MSGIVSVSFVYDVLYIYFYFPGKMVAHPKKVKQNSSNFAK